ncbi:MAG: hypothetical protein DDT37_01035 [Firmicutes bacterium]|nr:hypothetical protein [candidate division NPL-UPA2 bacterium]
MRREIPIIITLVIGVIFLLGPIVSGNIPFTEVSFSALVRTHLSPWTTIIAAFALGLASVNLLRIHGNTISRKRTGWIYSAILIVTMVFFGVTRTWVELQPANREMAAFYGNFFNFLYNPLAGAMFALLAFYIASAAYRAFRLRSLEATILLVAAVIVMLGAAPVGALIWDYFPSLQGWLLRVPNLAGQRGIIIGAALGGFATSLRILLGLERGHLGGE